MWLRPHQGERVPTRDGGGYSYEPLIGAGYKTGDPFMQGQGPTLGYTPPLGALVNGGARLDRGKPPSSDISPRWGHQSPERAI